MARNAGADADRAWEKRLRRLGMDVGTLNIETSDEYTGDERIHELRFKCDADADTSVLIIVKAQRGGERLVAFVGAADFETAVLALCKKVRGGSLKYREDRPWGE